MRNRFDSQLENLNNMLIHMGELCKTAISEAAYALSEEDVDRAKDVMEADEEIDHMEKDIESLCLKLFLQQQPVASDLRQISAALKMITDMERIGDQASDIAEIIISAKDTGLKGFEDIGMMAKKASEMVTESVAAYVGRNIDLAKKVIKDDDIVDGLFDSVKGELADFIADDKANSDMAIDFIMIAKYLERIADHAANIAEWVGFSITGVHAGQKSI